MADAGTVPQDPQYSSGLLPKTPLVRAGVLGPLHTGSLSTIVITGLETVVCHKRGAWC